MQSTIYYRPSTSHNFQFPWKSSKIPACQTWKVSSKPPGLANSLRSQITYELKGGLNNDGIESSNPTKLPVVIRRYGKVSRYFGMGIDLFIPKQASVNYIGYVKWKFLHRVFSSALQVLATQCGEKQAMFRAIGIGYSRSLTSAAALNWVLKDGLGRLSRCIYTASLASAFDTNLKLCSYRTLFSYNNGEDCSGDCRTHFLLLASFANIAKQMSLACYMATSPPIHRSFAIADNLAEVSAKSQIQSVCFDNLGLVITGFGPGTKYLFGGEIDVNKWFWK
ncbi:Protein root UVB sensitive 4 [Hibiscus syriacus]|uniref:Protein root UVB sensitive 4 n=1 Tax=Hibiscus syriacus TaxID=106335 RepID=A0A6A2XC76_HIBSY|nr:Protein root UVB sensitive 4 [Hibiscus syriacus]